MLRNLVLLLLLIGLAIYAFIYGWNNLMGGNDSPTPPTSDPNSSTEWEIPPDAQAARITRVHDGDTLFLEATTSGNHITEQGEVKVRLVGIDTPEITSPAECYGKEATSALKSLTPVNSTVWVVTDIEAYDRYDRMLLYIWNESGTFVNMQMVANGYAEAIRVQPNDSYFTELKAAENAAYNDAAGMWGACNY